MGGCCCIPSKPYCGPLSGLSLEKITELGGHFVLGADDRVIEYSVGGSALPDAELVITAYMANYQLPPLPVEEAAYNELNLKSISISLPSIGNSGPNAGHSIADWPETDLKLVLEKEEIPDTENFLFWGDSLGSQYAIAVAQHKLFKNRVSALGLRVPYLPLTISKELGLRPGQMALPTSDELRRNTMKVKLYRLMFNWSSRFVNNLQPDKKGFKMWAMRKGLSGAEGKQLWTLIAQYRPEFDYVQQLMRGFGADSMLAAMAEDVALTAAVDPRRFGDNGNTVVWYSSDDGDCPPEHGKWLAEECFPSGSTRVLNGVGHVGGGIILMGEFLEELQKRGRMRTRGALKSRRSRGAVALPDLG